MSDTPGRDPSGVAEACKIFEALKGGTMAERVAASDQLVAGVPDFDRAQLRSWILEALCGDYDATRASPERNRTKANARGWLLGSLGRIADGDPEATKYLEAQLDPAVESNPWSRHWTLEGLVIGRYAELGRVAGKALHDPDALVSMLARAVLAEQEEPECLRKLLDALEGRHLWPPLRALRIVPLPQAVHKLRDIASAEQLTDETYDAIVALSAVPPSWPEAGQAVLGLTACVKNCRRHPWWDALRAKALRALGDLEARDAEAILVEEIADHNPSIVYEAARALERVAGTAKATDRIVEAASTSEAINIVHYANALRYMDREAAVDRLEQIMLASAPRQRDVAQALLREVGGEAAFQKLRARTDAMKRYEKALGDTEQKLQEMFTSSLNEARQGYRLSTVMDVLVFGLGIFLIVFSVVLIAQGKTGYGTFVAAGGALGVLYSLFFANPRTRVVEAVDHLMSLKVLFLAYLRQLHQADQAYIRRLLDDAAISPETVVTYNDLIGRTMQQSIEKLEAITAARYRRWNQPKTRTSTPPPSGEPAPAPAPAPEATGAAETPPEHGAVA